MNVPRSVIEMDPRNSPAQIKITYFNGNWGRNRAKYYIVHEKTSYKRRKQVTFPQKIKITHFPDCLHEFFLVKPRYKSLKHSPIIAQNVILWKLKKVLQFVSRDWLTPRSDSVLPLGLGYIETCGPIRGHLK